MNYHVSSPTRVDLAGGTLDLWPLFLLIDDCVTVNLSIDIETHARIAPRRDQAVKVDVMDLKYQRTFSSLAELIKSKDKELSLVKAVISYFRPDQGFEVSTRSDSPVGGGLGGSSSLCISLIRAFKEWLHVPMDLGDMVEIAHNIEARLLRAPTGTQDYVPAAAPGLKLIRYGVDRPKIESLPFSVEEFSEKMILVYTGRPHHSGINNWQVLKAAVEGDQRTLENLRELSRVARDCANVCLNGDWDDLPQIFKEEYRFRSALSPSFTSPEIQRLESVALKAGAESVKICGAGGGGCVMLWVPAANKQEVVQQCQKNGFQVLQTAPVGAP